MERRKRDLAERVLAFCLAVALLLTGVLPHTSPVIVQATENQQSEGSTGGETGDSQEGSNNSGETSSPENSVQTVTTTINVYKEDDKLPVGESDVTIAIQENQTNESIDATDGVYSLTVGTLYKYELAISESSELSNNYKTTTGSFIAGEGIVNLYLQLKDIVILDGSDSINLSSPITTSTKTIPLDSKYDLKVVDGTTDVIELKRDNNQYIISNKLPGTTKVAAYYKGRKISNEVTVTVKSHITNSAINITAPQLNEEGKPSITDVTSVEVTVSGLVGVTGNFECYLEGERLSEVNKSDSSTGEIKFTYNDNDNPLTGDLKFTVKYLGDDKYESRTWEVELEDLKLSQSIVFESDNSDSAPLVVKQVQNGVSFPIEISGNSIIGDEKEITYTLDTKKSDSGVLIEVTGNGTKDASITVKEGTGLVAIKVSVAGNETYAPAEAIFYAYVEKTYTLSDLNGKLQINAVKTYDGTNEVTVEAIMSSEELNKLHIKNYGDVDVSKWLVFTLEGTVASQNVKYDSDGEVIAYDSITVTAITNVQGYLKNGTEKVNLTKTVGGTTGNADTLFEYIPWTDATLGNGITLTGNNTNKVAITINPRTVYLYTKDFTVPYGTDALTAVKSATGLVCAEAFDAQNGTGIIVNDDSKPEIDVTQFTATITTQPENGVYDVGEYKNYITFDETKVSTYKNYTFEISSKENAMGTLKVVPQDFDTIQKMLQYVDFYVVSPTGETTPYYLYQNSSDLSELWLSGGVLKAKFKDAYKDTLGKYYNKIILKYDIPTTEGGGTTNSVTVADGTEGGGTTNSVMVADLTKEGYDTDGLGVNNTFTGSVYFALSGTEDATSSPINASASESGFSFTIDKTAPTVTFTGVNANKVEDSSWWDNLFNTYVKEEYSIGVTCTDKQNGVEQSGVKDWKYHIYNATSGKDNKAEVQAHINKLSESNWTTSTDDGKIPLTDQGNYIVLVKATDNVENSIIYASNGVIYEAVPPVVTILGVETTYGSENDVVINASDSLNKDKVYKNNIAYKVIINDKATDAVITSGLKEITVDVLDNGTSLGTGYQQTVTFLARATLADIASSVEKTLTGMLVGLNSDNLVIQVTAIDYAGNESVVTQALKIDNVAPKIDVVNNVTNGGYYNAPKTITVTYTERHFDESKALFDISLTGVSQGTKTLEQLKNNEVSGITVTKETTSGTGDATQHTYEITFGKDGTDIDFVLIPSLTDTAGNSVTGGKISLTVDMVAPVINVTFTDESGSTISGVNTETDVNKWYHTNKTIKATVSIKERNFEKGTVTASSMMSYYDTTGAEKENSNLLALANDKSKWTKDNNGDVYEQTFTFEADANYTFDITYTDVKGNKVSFNAPYNFVVDKTAPTGSITVQQLGTETNLKSFDGFLETITFGFYRNDGYRITFTSEDVTSIYKQSYFMYEPTDETVKIVQTNTSDATKTSLNIVSDFSQWKDEGGYKRTNANRNQVIEIENESQKVPYLRLEDKAGNVSFISAEGVITDKTNPSAPDISINMVAPKGYGIYNADVPFSITVTDPTSPTEKGTYAGIKSISYEILKDGVVTQKASYTEETARKQTVTWTSDTLKVNAKDNNSNNVVIRVTAVDYAGNSTTAGKAIMIDTTKPTLSITYDNKNVLNGNYYKGQRTATITYTERNFNESLAKFSIAVGKNNPTTYSLVELKQGKVDGVTIKEVPDTVSGDSTTTTAWTDERTITYQLTFGKDGYDYDFTVLPSIEDEASNTGESVQEESFTVDMVKSVLKVEYYTDKNCTESSKISIGSDVKDYSFGKPIYVKVTVEERNFKSTNGLLNGQMSVACTTAKEADKTSIPNYQSLAENTDGWKTTANNANVYTQVFAFEKDAEYTFNLTYTDLAGNETSLLNEPVKFLVDTTKPTGTIKIDNTSWDKFVSTITFGIFSNTLQEVYLEPSDVTSGVATAYYHLSKVQLQESDMNSVTWTEFDNSYSFEVEPDTQFIVYAKIVDNVGNVKYISTDGAITDDEKPVITLNSLTESDGTTTNNIYNSDAVFNITVKDPTSDGATELNKTFSGLEKVWYTVSAKGNVTNTQTVTLLDNTANKKQGNQEFKKEFKISASDFNSNEVEICIYAVDFARNQQQYTTSLQFDTTAPVVSVTYDADTGKPYNSFRTATVTYTERNFAEELAKFAISVNGNESTVTLSQLLNGTVDGIKAVWKSDTQTGKDDRTIQYELTFGKNGEDYDFSVKPLITDKAGNVGVAGAVKTFTVDMVAPTISVKYDNNSPSNERYFASKRTMTLTYVERYFDAELALFDITVNGTLNKGVTLQSLVDGTTAIKGIVVKEATVTKEEQDAYKHVYTITFGNSDKEYDFAIIPSVTDPSGNSNTGVTYADGTKCEDTFTVDMKMPEISVSYLENGVDITDKINTNKWYYTNNTIYARVTIKEHNFIGSEFAQGQMNVVCDKTNSDDSTDYQELANKRAGWEKVAEDTYTQEFALKGNAKYAFNFTYKDLANNSDSLLTGDAKYQFVVDKVMPTGSVKFVDKTKGPWSTLVETITFGIFKNDAYNVSVTPNDTTAGIKTAYYYLYVLDEGTEANPLKLDDLKALSETEWKELKANEDGTFEIKESEMPKPNQQFVAYIKLVDKSGNSNYISTDGAVADDTAPVVTVSNLSTPSKYGYYNVEDVVFKVVATDNASGNTYSGIKKIWYTVSATGNVENSEEVVIENNDRGESNVQGSQTVEDFFSISTKDYNSNNVVIKVYAEDFSGNVGEAETINLKIDVTEPQVEMEYDSTGVSNGTYYKADRTAIVTYTERNFNTELATFDIKVNESKETFTLKELMNGAVEGIKVKALGVEGTEDNQTTKYQLTFGKNGEDYDFTVTPAVKDMADNSNKTKAKAETFTVDRVTPVVKVQYYTNEACTNEITVNDKDWYYADAPIFVKLTVTERNFAKTDKFVDGQIQVICEKENVKDNTAVTDFQTLANNRSRWNAVEGKKDTYTQVFTFEGDAKYKFNFIYKDLAENEESLLDGESKYQFVVDTTAPTGKIGIDGKEFWDNLIQIVTFNIFKNESYTISLQTDDITSGVKTAYYYKDASGVALTVEDLNKVSDWTEFDETNTFNVKPNEQFVAYAKIVDKSGNVTYISTNGAVSDNVAPTISVSFEEFDKDTSESNIYNSNASFEITVEDPTVGGTFSGLEKVWYIVSAKGNVEKDVEVVLTDNSSNKTKGNQLFTTHFEISAKTFNSNDVEVRIGATDFSGNTYVTEPCLLEFDTTAPTVQMEYDTELVPDYTQYGQYYKEVRTATVTYVERNFSEELALFTLSVNGSESTVSLADILNKKVEGVSAKRIYDVIGDVNTEEINHTDRTDDRELQYQLTFGKDGKDYDFVVTPSIIDMAGNTNEKSAKAETFTVDMVAPQIRVAYDDNAPHNKTYFNSVRTMTITYAERNFAEELATFVIRANGTSTETTLASLLSGETKLNGVVAKNVTTKNNTESNEHVYTIAFGKDGYDCDFEVIPSVTDKSANSNADNKVSVEYAKGTVCKDAFTVDMVVPEIKVQYLELQSKEDTKGKDITSKINADTNDQNWYYTNKTVKAVVTITERNFTLEKAFSNQPKQVVVDYKKTYVKSQTAQTDYVMDAETVDKWNPTKGNVYNQTFVFDGEADYEFNLTYTDLAGNTISLLDGTTYKFVVDKTVPTGTITVKELGKNGTSTVFDKLLGMISFGLYHNEGFEIKFESKDITSIYNQSYFMYATKVDMHGKSEQLEITNDVPNQRTLTGIDRNDWVESIKGYGRTSAVKTQKVVVAENTQQIPYMRLEDKAGNVSFISSEGVIYDCQEPNGPEITIDVAEPKYAIYNGDVPFTVKVTDPTTNGTYAGLESITFEIINNVKEVKDGVVQTTPKVTQSGAYGEFNKQLADKTARVQSVTWTSSEDKRLVIDSTKNNSNYVTIKVTATDYAGNVSIKTKDVMIDIIKPKVEIVYDDSTPVNEKYYNHTKTAKVTYTERNFDENLATFDISVNGKKQTVSLANLMAGKVDGIVVSSYPTELIGFATDESTYEYELIFGKDTYDYDFEITPAVQDRALNVNVTKAKTEVFTVDMVIPEIEIQYVEESNKPITSINTDNDEQNWYYTNKTVKAIVTITERNFALEKAFSNEPKQMVVDYKKTYVKPQTAQTDYVMDAETASKWNLSKDNVYSQTFIFDGEADYELNFTYTDLAGNTISLLDETTYKFVVDKTAPTGTITVKELGTQGTTTAFDKLLSMISFGLYYNEGFAVTFESNDITSIYRQSYFMYATEEDMHGEYEQLKVTDDVPTERTLEGIARESWIGEDAYARQSKAQVFKTSENTQQIPYMRLEDKAGNVSFISAEGVIDDRSNPEAPQITIDLEEPDHGIYEEKDGVPFTMTVVDPTVNGTYAGLKSVSYEILKDGVVTQSGNYDAELADKTQRIQTITHQEVIDTTKNNSNDVKIVVNAIDYAGNTSTMTKEVMIDITAPKIHVEFNNDADMKNGKYFNTDRIMTITITERNMEKGSTADGITFDVKAGVEIGKQEYDTDITLSELKSHYGVDYKWISDSEAGVEASKLSDARKNVLELTFSKDNEYYIVPHSRDLGDNTESSLTYANDTAYAREFVIDKTAPVIEVTYNLENVTADNSKRAYSGKTVNARVSVTEQNFWIEGTKFSKEPLQWNFDKTVGTEMAETINDYQAEANDVKQWARNVIVSQKTFEFAKDANYAFGFTYVDLAGNVAVYEPHYFTVDKTLPEGTITLDGRSVWNNFWQIISFNIFKDDTYQIVMTSKDATAGVASTAYYKAQKPLTEEEVKALANEAWNILNPNDMTFKVSPDEQFVVYGRIIDRSGNVRFIYPTNGAVADLTKPVIEVTNLTPARNEIHNTDVKFHVDVKDPTSGNTYSGLEKVWYTVKATGNVSAAEEVVLVDNSANKVQGNQEWSGEFTISSQKFNSNQIEIQVYAKDFTGNTYNTEVIPLKIDITEPTVNITYDLNAPSNEKYYKDVRTAVISVTERNFDPDGVRINITNTDGTAPAISEWSKGAGTGISDETINTCTVTFSADGDYTFMFDCTDLSGNVSQVVQTEEFTIDRTIPTIDVGYDNNNPMNDFYYATPRTATITVTEHNFNGSEVQAAINASLEAQGIPAPGVNGWHTSGDTHSATILFDEDGDYGFTLNYGDLAGNPAVEFVAPEFTIDQTKPVIEITDIEDRSANNGEVRPAISYSDVNYDEQNVTITIKGVKHSETSVDGTRSTIHNGQSIKLDDFAHEESEDDVYTLTASVVDRAGNSEEQSVLFSVNRFGSTYMFSEATTEFLNKYYSNKEKDLVVTEINVDNLERRDVSYGRDGELVNLEEGVDYSVEESGNEVSWKSFQYTISAKNFEEEGLYNVTIDSKDTATNEVNNKIKDADISFVIDKTSPSVVITGIESEHYTDTTRDITLNIADNVAVAKTDVYVNDDVVTFDAEVIKEQNGKVNYTLESSDEWQKVYAVATDAAGNTASSDEYRVLVSAELLVQILNNPVLLGAVATVAAGGLGAASFVFKRRKKAK